MQATIVLTGATGFLGKIIADVLISHKNEIITIGRQNSNTIISDLSLNSPILIKNEINIVIHAAGKAHSIPRNDKEIKAFFDVNVTGTKNLLAGIENSGSFPNSFIFISSVAVYGLSHGVLINENFPSAAKDPYGLSKIQAEQLVLDWCQKNDVICTILRLPLVAGQNPPGNLGAMLKGIKKGYYFNIAGGKAKKSMVLAEDVAKAIVKVSNIGGIYNLTDGYHPTFSEISNCISSQLGKGKPLNMPLWLAKIFARFGDFLGSKAPLNTNKLNKITSDLTFDDTKAREVFGWNPTPVLNGFNLKK
jgi:nucleoside-diphosphate-sugar epimerase